MMQRQYLWKARTVKYGKIQRCVITVSLVFSDLWGMAVGGHGSGWSWGQLWPHEWERKDDLECHPVKCALKRPYERREDKSADCYYFSILYSLFALLLLFIYFLNYNTYIFFTYSLYISLIPPSQPCPPTILPPHPSPLLLYTGGDPPLVSPHCDTPSLCGSRHFLSHWG